MDKSCATDADCVIFGIEPTAACPRSAFTNRTSLATHASEFRTIAQALVEPCEPPLYMCAQFVNWRPTCDVSAKICGPGLR